MRAWGKLKRLSDLVDKSFYLFLSFGAIWGKNCFSKRATYLQFLKQKVKIEMELILRWGSVQGVHSTVNGLYLYIALVD